MTGKLAGRVALLTGATRGIGAELAPMLAAEGAHLILLGRSRGALERVDDRVRAVSAAATLVEIDLAAPERIEELAAVVQQRYGRLDLMIGNAATLGLIGPMGHMAPDMLQKVLDVNLIANWRLIRAFDPLLRRAPGARAAFVTCEVGHVATPFWSAYAISKAALEMMVKVWSAELSNTDVKVDVIDPGPARTGLRRAAFPAEDPETVPAAEAAARMIALFCTGCEN